ncbi:MAG: hypothetical protein WA895_32445 [Streptosporangiaceae bacterium]
MHQPEDEQVLPAGEAAAQAEQMAELLATGRYPRFAAAITQPRPPDPDARPHFDRLLDRVLDGLIGVRRTDDAE